MAKIDIKPYHFYMNEVNSCCDGYFKHFIAVTEVKLDKIISPNDLYKYENSTFGVLLSGLIITFEDSKETCFDIQEAQELDLIDPEEWVHGDWFNKISEITQEEFLSKFNQVRSDVLKASDNQSFYKCTDEDGITCYRRLFHDDHFDSEVLLENEDGYEISRGVTDSINPYCLDYDYESLSDEDKITKEEYVKIMDDSFDDFITTLKKFE